MITVFWLFLVSFFCVLVELLYGYYGLAFPGAFFLCLYLGGSYGVPSGLLLGSLTAVSVEIIYCRSWTILPLMPVAACYARIWRNLGHRVSLAPQTFSGAMMAAVYFLYGYVGETGFTVPSAIREFLFSLGTIIIVSAMTFSVLMFIHDEIAAITLMKTFRNKKGVRFSG